MFGVAHFGIPERIVLQKLTFQNGGVIQIAGGIGHRVPLKSTGKGTEALGQNGVVVVLFIFSGWLGRNELVEGEIRQVMRLKVDPHPTVDLQRGKR